MQEANCEKCHDGALGIPHNSVSGTVHRNGPCRSIPDERDGGSHQQRRGSDRRNGQVGGMEEWKEDHREYSCGPKGRDCGSKRSHAGKFGLKVAHAGTVGRHGEILRWTGMGGRTE